MEDNLVAAIAVTLIFGAPCAVWMVSRVLAHQERMEMLRRGFIPPPNSREMNRAMKRGWIPPSPGTSAGQSSYGYEADLCARYQLRRGIQVACVGLALIIGLGFIGYRGNGTFVYGPWLLGGLIPFFVGVAQIVGAVLSGATFGSPHASGPFGPSSDVGAPPPGSPNASNTPRPTYGGWRPGPTPEIEKPASPPDYRS